jgi:hypothetical protein
MVRWKRFVLLVLVLSEGVAVGCSSKAASPQQPQKLEMKVGDTTAPIKQVGRVGKPAPRESGFSTYNVPEYGVTFHYPRNFALDEGAPEGVSGIRSREELEGEEPGAELVATVVVPDDAYPNTTFAGGSLQFAVNRYLTATGCRESLIARLGDSNGPAGSVTIQNVAFAWTEGDAGDAGTEFFERDYAGFANGTCYEFFLRVGVGSATDEEGVRPADEKKILGNLEKIVASLQIQPKPVSVLDETPTVQSAPRKR